MDAFEWDEWNLDHIARHQVSPAEVEEIIAGDAIELPVQFEDGDTVSFDWRDIEWKNAGSALYGKK